MEKVIVENHTKLPMDRVLMYVMAVISKGRVSNYGKQYCYTTTYNDGITVAADLNKKSDRFVVYKETE